MKYFCSVTHVEVFHYSDKRPDVAANYDQLKELIKVCGRTLWIQFFKWEVLPPLFLFYTSQLYIMVFFYSYIYLTSNLIARIHWQTPHRLKISAYLPDTALISSTLVDYFSHFLLVYV